jgi:hypothetical protein
VPDTVFRAAALTTTPATIFGIRGAGRQIDIRVAGPTPNRSNYIPAAILSLNLGGETAGVPTGTSYAAFGMTTVASGVSAYIMPSPKAGTALGFYAYNLNAIDPASFHEPRRQ